MPHRNPSPTVEFECSPPECFGVLHEWLMVKAWLSPGYPATRWEPGEPPHLEEVLFATEDGELAGDDPIYSNNGFIDYIEQRAMDIAAERYTREEY